MKQSGISRIREVLDARVEIKSAELLKSQNTSLLNDLEKIKSARLETPQKLSPDASKAAVLLER